MDDIRVRETKTLTIFASFPLEIDGCYLGYSDTKKKVIKFSDDHNGWKFGNKAYKCSHDRFLDLLIQNGWNIRSASLSVSCFWGQEKLGKTITTKLI